ncbi:MAG: hypothetical protein V3R25_09200 [Nitrosomonadaceae bacterium]
MAKVDPYVQRIPRKFLEDPELRPWFEYLNRFLHDLWQRSGGGDDAIDALEVGELYEPGIQTNNSDELIDELETSQEMALILDLNERVEELENDVHIIPATEFTREIVVLGAAVTVFTSTGTQTIICNNTGTLTLTLNLTPDDGEDLNIKRRDAAVSVVGSIDGADPTAILSQFDNMHAVFTLGAAEWGVF